MESVLNTINENLEYFDASAIDSSDLLQFSKRVDPDLSKIYDDWAVLSLTEVELDWFMKGYTSGFNSGDNPSYFILQKVQWGKVPRGAQQYVKNQEEEDENEDEFENDEEDLEDEVDDEE